jgi:flagellar assembly protein FliH
MTTCSESARPVELSDLEQLAPPPSQDPVIAAQAIIDAARAEAGALRAQAVADGRAEGIRLGRQDAAVELEPAVAALDAALGEARALRDAIVDDAEKRAAQLGLAIAEKIVAAAIEIEPGRVADVVRGALRGLLDGDRIIVSVHPDDVELVRAAVVGSPEHPVEILAERRVARGGAVVRTSVGEVDARIAGKLDAVRALVTAELGAA